MSDAKLHATLLKSLEKIDVRVIRPEPVRRTPTRILSLDTVFHGGLPEGRIVEMFGEANFGKSTTALLIARQYMNQGLRVALLDSEKTFDVEYAERFGMDVHALDENGVPLLDVFQATTAEQWLDTIRELLNSRLYQLIIVDTLAGFVPRVEYESSIDKGTMGVFPRLMARFMRVTGPLMGNGQATVLLLNQVRLDIGNANPYTGAPITTPGGMAVKHAPSIRIQLMKPQDKRVGDKIVGVVFRYKIVKSKLFTPDVKAVHELHIVIDEENQVHEVDTSYELLQAGKNLGLIVGKDGRPWESRVAFFEGVNLGNGEKQILEFLDEPSDIRSRLEQRIYDTIEKGQSLGQVNSDPGDPEPVPEPETGDGDDGGTLWGPGATE